MGAHSFLGITGEFNNRPIIVNGDSFINLARKAPSHLLRAHQKLPNFPHGHNASVLAGNGAWSV